MADIQTAARVLKAAADLDGLSDAECRQFVREGSMNKGQCDALQRFFNKPDSAYGCCAGGTCEGSDVLSQAKRQWLKTARFSDRFIDALVGESGRGMQRERIRALEGFLVVAGRGVDAPGVRPAIRALEGMCSPEAIAALCNVVAKRGFRGDVSQAVVRALGDTRSRLATPTLLKLLVEGERKLHPMDLDWRSTDDLEAIAVALRKIGGPFPRETVALLVTQLDDRWGHAAQNAACALGGIAGAAEEPALVRVAKDWKRSPVVREWAVRALGMMASRRAVPAILKVFWYREDEHEFLRLAAAQALQKIGSPDLVPLFIDEMKWVLNTHGTNGHIRVDAQTQIAWRLVDFMNGVLRQSRSADARRVLAEYSEQIERHRVEEKPKPRWSPSPTDPKPPPWDPREPRFD